MPPPGRFDVDWRRIGRYCAIITLAMFVWLMIPVVKCSFAAFKDTPIGEIAAEDAAPSGADKDRVVEAQGFVGRLTSGCKQCYLRTPLLGQETWKGQILIWGAVATALAWLIARIQSRRPKTFT